MVGIPSSTSCSALPMPLTLVPTEMITKEQFAAQGLSFSREAGVENGLHCYFVQHCSRLYQTCKQFGLFDDRLGDVMEIGAFYGYTPFFLQPLASSQIVLEGDDPAVYALKPLYEKRNIRLQFVDLFEIFGPTHTAQHQLPLPSNSLVTILCWETMEHLNFYPVRLNVPWFPSIKSCRANC